MAGQGIACGQKDRPQYEYVVRYSLVPLINSMFMDEGWLDLHRAQEGMFAERPIVHTQSDDRLLRGDIAVQDEQLGTAQGDERCTYKVTSCFHTGLCADMRDPKRPASWDLPEPRDEDGVACALLRALPFPLAFSLIAPRAESAVDDELRERLVATPLTSLSVSSVGSRLTNSFCSN